MYEREDEVDEHMSKGERGEEPDVQPSVPWQTELQDCHTPTHTLNCCYMEPT